MPYPHHEHSTRSSIRILHVSPTSTSTSTSRLYISHLLHSPLLHLRLLLLLLRLLYYFSLSLDSIAASPTKAMLLRASPSLSLPSYASDGAPASPASLSAFLRLPKGGSKRKTVPMAVFGANSRPVAGVIFEPFEELKQDDSFLVPSMPDQSLARQKFTNDCEAAINDQINVEYNVSYVYHAMYAYFDRDNVALKGLAKFFKESSVEEREHAEKLMEYQNKRGGRVKLQSIMMPPSEFDHPEKGDALNAMELVLSLEKLTNEKLLNLHNVATHSNDAQLADFVESEFLEEQVEAIKKISEFVAQLRRVGKGHGVWHFDQMLLHEGAAA